MAEAFAELDPYLPDLVNQCQCIVQTETVSSLQSLSCQVIVKTGAYKTRIFPPGLQTTVNTERTRAEKEARSLLRLEKMAVDYEHKVTELVPSKDGSGDGPTEDIWELLSLECEKNDIKHFRSNACIWCFSWYKYYGEPDHRDEREYLLSLHSNAIVPEAGPVTDHFNFTRTTPSVIGNTALAVLCKLINVHLRRPLIPSVDDCNEEEFVEQAIIQVRESLRKLCPNLVNWMFAEAMPYVWWSRGNFRRAEKAFLDIVRDEHHVYLDVQKATYSNELGRLYLHFGLYDKATQSFMAAGNLMGACTQELQPLFNIQAMILSAAGLDTGVLTKDHTRSSLAMWGMIMQSRTGDLFHRTVQAAVNSVLCHHSGVPFDHETWTDSAISWLEGHVEEYPLVQLGLSFLYAILGKETESNLAYKNYINRFALPHNSGFSGYLPGQIWHQSSGRGGNMTSRNPWTFVMAQVQCHGQIKPMRTIWRRQLCHFTMDKIRKWRVADCDHASVSITEAFDGSIKCDIHSLLPPLDPVLFHALTGSLLFRPEYTQVCRDPKYCHELKEFPVFVEHVIHQGDDYLLRYTELEASQAGMSGSFSELKWEGPNGKALKLDLGKIIKEEFYQSARTRILENALAVPEVDRPSYIKKRIDILEAREREGFTLDTQVIERELARKGGKQYHGEKQPTNISEHFSVSLMEFRNLHGAVVLLFWASRLTDHSYLDPSVIVIVNHTNLEKFAKPIVKILKGSQSIKKCSTLRRMNDDVYFFCPDLPFAAGLDPAFPRAFGLKVEDKNLGVHRAIYDLNGEIIFPAIQTNTFLDMFEESLIVLDPEAEKFVLVSTSGHKHVINLNVIDLSPLCGLMLLLTEDQLRIHSPRVFEGLRWKLYKTRLELSEDGCGLKLVHSKHARILWTMRLEHGMSEIVGPVYHCLLGCGNHVLVIEFQAENPNPEECHCLLDVEVAGMPSEGCFISEKAGFLVAATIHHWKDEEFYSENLYQYSYDGHLLSALANLGHGPHGFLPIYQKESTELLKEYPDMPYGEGAWYVYFRDGHGAVMCVRLPL